MKQKIINWGYGMENRYEILYIDQRSMLNSQHITAEEMVIK